MLKYIHHSPHMLSGGQKQRVAIAGVLAMNPKCLVLDEATSMLDPTGRRDVIRILQKLNREDGITVILITHHMDEAAHADRVMVINRGSLVLEGTPREVFANSEILKKAGLDIPEVTSLYIRAVNEGIVKGGEIPVLMDELEKVLLKLDFVDSRKQERTHESPDGITESREKIIEIKTFHMSTCPARHMKEKPLTMSRWTYTGEKSLE